MRAINNNKIFKGGTFEVDQSNRIEELEKHSFVAIANSKYKICLKLPKVIKRQIHLFYKLKNKSKSFPPETFAYSIVFLLKHHKLYPAKLIIDHEYPGHEPRITEIIKNNSKDITVTYFSIGKDSPAHIAAYSLGKKSPNSTKKLVVTPISAGTTADLHPAFTGIQRRTRPK